MCCSYVFYQYASSKTLVSISVSTADLQDQGNYAAVNSKLFWIYYEQYYVYKTASISRIQKILYKLK